MQGQGAVQLVTMVGQLVGKEYRQIRGVGGQVAELSDELDTMNAILRMLSDAEDGSVDHFIRVWMKQVRELSYDAEDCVHLYIFRIRCRPRDLWSKTKHIFTTLFARRRLACEIRALRARAIVIGERHARYGVSREALLRITASLTAPASLPGHALGRPAANDPDHPIGIDDQANALAEMVAPSNNEGDMKLKVFSVWGFGGLGKTTLARKVCRQLESKFQRQAQVSVSQAFRGTEDLKGLLKRVLVQIVKPKVDNPEGIEEEDPLGGIDRMDVDQLTRKLNGHLKDTRYLIMVDDVWTVAAWNTIRSSLPDYNNGSRIIVTTRMETVAEACSDAKKCIYRVKPLGTEDSKILFLSKVIGSKGETLPNNLKAEMGRILKKCGGLPMAIISIACILSSYTSSESKDMWERVCKSIGSQLESNPTLEGMRQIITLSYNHLHYYLKGCMMYLSIFPEDYVIVKDRLLKRWIAEGLVAGIRGLTLMEVAEGYYNELASRSMIDRADDIVTHYDGRLEACRVHDMTLEVMVSKSLEANFVSLIGGPYEGMSYSSIRRLSIHAGEEMRSVDYQSNKIAASHDRKNGTEGMKMEHVRSLSMFDLKGHTQVLDRLGEFSLLRVLDLEDCMGIENKHLKHVCRMYLLMFLSMKGTSITDIPPEIGDLENLETLDVRETSLENLPETVSKLEKLEHLQINNKADRYLGCWTPRKGMGRMKALRVVNAMAFGSDADAAKELGELQQLRELRIHMDAIDDNYPCHQDVRKKLAESLNKMHSLRWLSIGGKGQDNNALDFLNDLDPQQPWFLQYLRIGGGINKMPDWVSSLYNLVEFVIAWTYLVGDQLFDPVCKLPNLKRMHLEAYCYKDTELVAQTATFPELKDLHVNFYVQQMEVLRFQEASMAKLERLSMQFSEREFTKEVVGIKHLTNLKEVKLIGKKHSPALNYALKQLKTMNEDHKKSKQVKIVVQYE